MHQRPAFVLVLLTGWLVGCATGEPVERISRMQRLSAFQGPIGPDVVQLDVALIERPVGDHYVNEELWVLADEQRVPLECKSILEENGFRIGQTGEIPPSRLRKLLTSEQYCVNPRSIRLHAGKKVPLTLGPPLPLCSFRSPQDRQTVVELHQALCKLMVVPTLTPDGRTCLRFTPQVTHGELKQIIRAAEDHSDFQFHTERPVEEFPNLSWDVSLAPNEFLIIGACYQQAQTLGHRCFIRADETPAVQRLLVIRTSRQLPGVMTDFLLDGDDGSNSSLPLALQAIWPAARAASP